MGLLCEAATEAKAARDCGSRGKPGISVSPAFIHSQAQLNEWLTVDFKKWCATPVKIGRTHDPANKKRCLPFSRYKDKRPYRSDTCSTPLYPHRIESRTVLHRLRRLVRNLRAPAVHGQA